VLQLVSIASALSWCNQ